MVNNIVYCLFSLFLALYTTFCRDISAAPRIPAFVSIKGYTLAEKERELLQKYRPVGIILFEKNCENEKQLTELTTELKKMGFIIAVDLEGKTVNRFRKFYTLDKNAADFRISDLTAVYDYHHTLAKYAKKLGIDIIFGPVTDISDNSSSFMYKRTFSGNPREVAERALVVVQAYQDAGIFPVIKHLPGHGKATDTHVGMAFVDTSEKSLKNEDMRASKLVIDLLNAEKRPLPGAMVSHVIYKNLDANSPGTFSKKIIQENIRKYIGIEDGLLFSDSLEMNGIVNFLTQDESITEKNYRPIALQKFLQAGGDIAIMDSIEFFELTPNAFITNDEIMTKIKKNLGNMSLKK